MFYNSIPIIQAEAGNSDSTSLAMQIVDSTGSNDLAWHPLRRTRKRTATLIIEMDQSRGSFSARTSSEIFLQNMQYDSRY